MRLLGNTLIRGIYIDKSSDYLNIRLSDLPSAIKGAEEVGSKLYIRTVRGVGSSRIESLVPIRSVTSEAIGDSMPIYKVTDAIADRMTDGNYEDYSIYALKGTKVMFNGAIPIDVSKVVNSDQLVMEEFQINNPIAYDISVGPDSSGLLPVNIVINNIIVKL